MENIPGVLLNASEFIKGRLYFVSLNTDVKPKSTPTVHYFTVDTEYRYENFYKDFGPFNLAVLYHYCMKVEKKLKSGAFLGRKIVHYTGPDDEKRVNGAYLIGCYAIIYLKLNAFDAFSTLIKELKKPYVDFRDASCGDPYELSLLDCLQAVKKAHDYNFFNFNDFDHVEYEHYERVENGDLNWILPNKFIAFCGPHNKSKIEFGYYVHSPETYFGYFRRNGVSTIVRLNYEVYEANKFVLAGFEHKDLYFVDGGTPNDKIVELFLNICEEAKGAIAVHCKAGLGRTGTLIACYIIKHYKFTAEEAIAWIRICRPGSVIGHQQEWLCGKEAKLWSAGESYRKQKGTTVMKHEVGIYSLVNNQKKKNANNLSSIEKKVDNLGIKDSNDNANGKSETKPTQGDKLNAIKAQRLKMKPIITNMYDTRVFRTKVQVNGINTTKTTKLMSTSQTKVAHTSRHVLAKRNELTEPTARRVSQRKIVRTMSSPAENPKPVAGIKTPRKKENVLRFPSSSNLGTKSDDEVVKIATNNKRTKRTINSDQDKVTTRSVKVLRRVATDTPVVLKGNKSKLLPFKVNKTI